MQSQYSDWDIYNEHYRPLNLLKKLLLKFWNGIKMF